MLADCVALQVLVVIGRVEGEEIAIEGILCDRIFIVQMVFFSWLSMR